MAPPLERAIVRVLGARDVRLTVLAVEAVTPHYRRIQVSVGDLFVRHGHHPTMWLRLWFERDGRTHQRAFTLIDVDTERGTAWVEFALHDGVAADWARAAEPGTEIEASLLGSKAPWPTEEPRYGTSWERTVLVGSMASLPAIKALLERWAGADVMVLLESRDADDVDVPLPLGPHHRLERFEEGAGAVEERAAQLVDPSTRFWITSEAAQTRSIVKHLRSTCGVPKNRIVAQAYWTRTA